MAKFETCIQTDFDGLIHRIEEGILQGSLSASLEDRMAVILQKETPDAVCVFLKGTALLETIVSV